MANIRKTFSLPEEMVVKLDALQEGKSFSTGSTTLQYCISEAYERFMRNEVRVKKVGDTDDKMTVDERRKDREEVKCRNIAERLDADLIAVGDSFEVEYYKYSKQGAYKQKLPLLSLTEDAVEKQYFPSREVVEKGWEKEGVNYYKGKKQ